jgi:hypothetical protein
MLTVVVEVLISLFTKTQINRATVFIGLSIASVVCARLVLDIIHHKEVMQHYGIDLTHQQIKPNTWRNNWIGDGIGEYLDKEKLKDKQRQKLHDEQP